MTFFGNFFKLENWPICLCVVDFENELDYICGVEFIYCAYFSLSPQKKKKKTIDLLYYQTSENKNKKAFLGKYFPAIKTE